MTPAYSNWIDFAGRDLGYQVGGTDHHQQGDCERADIQQQ